MIQREIFKIAVQYMVFEHVFVVEGFRIAGMFWNFKKKIKAIILSFLWRITKYKVLASIHTISMN